MPSMTAIPMSAPAAGDNAVMSSNNAPPIAAIDPAILVFFDLFIYSYCAPIWKALRSFLDCRWGRQIINRR